jgi:hypothetical protein
VTAPYRAPGLARSELSASFESELLAELEPGERVVWTGLPEGSALFRRALGELLMPLAFNGFVLALVAMSSREVGTMALSAVPLVVLGLPLFRAPLGAWQAMRSTFYAVTDRRTLVFDADAIASVDRRDIVSVRVSHACQGAGVGDISLVVRPQSVCWPAPTLVGVPEARRVAAMLRAA